MSKYRIIKKLSQSSQKDIYFVQKLIGYNWFSVAVGNTFEKAEKELTKHKDRKNIKSEVIKEYEF